MKKFTTKNICMCFLFLSPLFLFSQGEWNNWYFGDSAAITFNTFPPSYIPNSAMFCSGDYPVSISDSLGNILFYSQHGKVYNQNNTLMPNGSGLLCYGVSQDLFAIKQPGTENLYYLFHVYSFLPNFFFGLYYSMLDMTLDGGMGDIVPGMKNIPVSDMSDAMELLMATRHKNNHDIWLLTKKFLTNQYAALLITESGISSSMVLSNSNFPLDPNYSNYNDGLKISPDGTILVCHHESQIIFSAEFCDFNSQTGIVTPRFNIQPYIGPEQCFVTCCGFSLNSKVLYIQGGLLPPSTDGGIFQYDISILDSTQIMNSQIMVYQKSPFQPPFGVPFQMGPDWKLYLPYMNHDSLHVIHNPNVLGIGCNFQRNAVSTGGRMVYGGLPQFLQKYKAYIGYTGNCQPDTFHFSSDIWPPVDTILWNFGDPASGAANFSTNSTPEHKFSSPGQYTIELYVRHIDNRTDTTWVTLNIYSLPMPDLGPDTIICQGDFITFDAGVCSGCTYLWTDITTGLPIGTGQTLTTDQTGIYAVTVTSGSNCQGRDTVQLIITPPPLITNDPLIKSICSGESTNIPLTSNEPNTDFSWTAIGSSPLVAGFSPGSGDTIDQVLANFGSASETVSYWITTAVGNCDGDSVQYVVTVTPGDSVMVTIASSADSVCNGTSVTFFATPANGGSDPLFHWEVNGNSAPLEDTIGLVAYYPFNGNTIDESGNGNYGFNNGAMLTYDRFGNPDHAYYFNGTSSFILVNQNASLEFGTGDFTVLAWTQTTSQQSARVVSKGECFNAGWQLGQDESIKISMQSPPNGPSYFSSVQTNYADGKWHQICFVRASGNVFLYGDGVFEGGPFSFPFSITNVSEDITIGRCRESFGSCDNAFFYGTIDDIQIFNRALSLPEIQQLYYDDSVYSYYPLNGDQIGCKILSYEDCITGNPANSNIIIAIVTESLTVDVSISASVNPFCLGDAVTFNAIPDNGGSGPLYDWYVNGILVGDNSPLYTYFPANGDTILCNMTSNQSCVTGNPATSNPIIMQGSLAPEVFFIPCVDTIITTNAKPIKLKGGIPLGGTYSGPGVSDGFFYPGIAGTGTHQIIYTYANYALCSDVGYLILDVRSPQPFFCGNDLLDIRDSTIYPTVQIGTQCWFASNLNYGTEIPYTTPQRDNCIPEKYTSHQSPVTSHSFYQWDELMNYQDAEQTQGLCPPGWHVPSESDWNQLFAVYQGNAFAGSPLLYSGYSGFDALLLGAEFFNNPWELEGFATLFWSSTSHGRWKAWAHGMNVYNYSVSYYPSYRANALSVRCLLE